MSNTLLSTTPGDSAGDERIWRTPEQVALFNKLKSAPKVGSITDKYELANIKMHIVHKAMMNVPEDELLIRSLLNVFLFSPDPRVKWCPDLETCAELLEDDALKKALQDALKSGDYREVMSFRRSLVGFGSVFY